MATVVSDTKPTTGGPWYYAGKQQNGVNMWTTQAPGGGTDDSGDTGGSSGSGSGSSGSSGSGSSGGGDEGLSDYIQEYRIRFITDGKPTPEMLKKAKDGNWSLAYFDMQVRLHDPNYLKSKEARSLLPGFAQTMKILFPGLSSKTKQAALMKNKFYRQQAVWYLRNGIAMQENGEELLYERITGTRKWNRNNPYWKMYAKNKDATVQAESNPLAYKAHLNAVKNAFESIGMQMSDDYYKQFFKSRYASESGFSDLSDNLKNYAATSGALTWFQGAPVTQQQTKTATLDSTQQGTDLRARMAKTLGVQSSFFGTDQNAFNTTLDERGKLVKKTL